MYLADAELENLLGDSSKIEEAFIKDLAEKKAIAQNQGLNHFYYSLACYSHLSLFKRSYLWVIFSKALMKSHLISDPIEQFWKSEGGTVYFSR